MSSEWGAPQTSDTPATASNGVDALLTRLEQVKRELRDLPHGLLKQAGISVVPGGIVLGGDVEVSGAVDVTGAMAVGGTLDVTGDAVFSGNLAVPNGSITNSALAAPVSLATETDDSVNFAISTGYGSSASVTFTVPAGFTRVDILAQGQASMYYTAATNPETLHARVVIAGNAGPEFLYLVDTSTVGARLTSAAVSHSLTIAGLTGGTPVVVSMQMRSYAVSWPANTYNRAAVSALAVFTRA